MPILRSASDGLLALAIGASGAVLFIYLGISLPWVLGSMLACALVSYEGEKMAAGL